MAMLKNSLATAILVLAGTAVEAQELYFRGGLVVENLTVSHDASPFAPLLGSPTSVLEFSNLTAPSVTLGMLGEINGWRYDVSASLAGHGFGAFEDTDYLASQIAFSHTTSTGALLHSLNGGLRLASPPLALSNGGSVRPHVVATAGSSAYAARGLTCGTPCFAPALPDSTTVIEQSLIRAAGGIGVTLDIPMAAGTLSLRGEATLGVAVIDDHHLLRPDLGPAPNILYRYRTMGVDLETQYRHAITDNLDVLAALGGKVVIGDGGATFGNAAGPQQTYSAKMLASEIRFSGGVAGSF